MEIADLSKYNDLYYNILVYNAYLLFKYGRFLVKKYFSTLLVCRL